MRVFIGASVSVNVHADSPGIPIGGNGAHFIPLVLQLVLV